jgi:cell division septal protein FtsQ
MASDPPFSDDLDGEVSPYRRRQRLVPARRSRFSRVKQVARWSLSVVLVVPLLGYVGYRTAVFALTAPCFMLDSPDDLTVEGNRYVSRQEVLLALGLSASWRRVTPVNIFHVSLSRAKRMVESIPWVLSASVARTYPNHLIVRVTERVPIAFVIVDGRLKLIDSEGVLLERPEKASFDFPVVRGLDSGVSPAERKLRLDVCQAFLAEVLDEVKTSGWMISEVDLSDGEDLKTTVFRASQTIQLHLGQTDFGQRFRNFLALLAELGSNGSQIDSMDLRYGGQVVVNPRPASAQGYATTTPAAGK